ncbi:MAG: hypothetical protein ACRDBO_00865 [Lachnospiraceae bacterium]
MEKIRERKDDLLAALMLVGFAFLINKGIEIKGLYMDDLYLWSCYGEQTFLEYVFPVGSTRFRFIYYLAAWMQMTVVGNHVEWFVPLNILLNAGVAFTIYRMSRQLSRSVYVGILLSIGYLASRMAYYQVGQVYGLMETIALWMAVGILYLLYQCCNESTGTERKKYLWACILYFGICFVHERYMVLFPMFFLVLFMRRKQKWRLLWAPVLFFGLVQLIRAFTIGSLSPAGTGGTDVADTFSFGTAIKYAFSQVAYLFGINAGPAYLNGENFRQSPLWVLILIGIADLTLIMLLFSLLIKIIRSKKQCAPYIGTSLLFLGFIACCIVSSSVTIRVEMRWVYVSFAAALLYLAWLYGVLTEGIVEKGRWMDALPYLAMVSIYILLMIPVEMHYRGTYLNLYLWPDQSRYNSLAEETYGKYNDDIFGKTIYIIGNSYEMSDFTAATFFKVFDRERKAAGTQVVPIDDIRDIGLVTEDMLILREEPQLNSFQDITQAVKEMKCRALYGYYADGWLDERAEIQVMAGSSGVIELQFDYPKDLGQEQWISIYVNGNPVTYLGMNENQVTTSVQAEPYELVTLRFESNFFVPDAQEQRGEYKLAVLLELKAD